MTWVNLVAVSDLDAIRPPLDRARAARLAPAWANVEVVEEAGSTNADLLARAHRGAPEGLVLVAEHQSAGRGRLDRAWQSPPGAGLTFSVLLRPGPVPAERWPWLPLLAGVAVAAGVAAAGGPRCGLKWPNDVLVGERKVGGLLVERAETASGTAAVVGIGLNVTTRPEELPVPTATSLRAAGMADPDRAALLGAVLTVLHDRYLAWRGPSGAPGLPEEYRARCVTLGRRVEVLLPAGASVQGTATDVDEGGGLVLATDGGPRVVTAGDVLHVRRVG